VIRCLVCNSDNPAGAQTCTTCGASLSGDPASGITNALPIGTRLHHDLYTIGKVLGQGGFGITYLGGDSQARRPVAVKEFFPYGSVRRGLAVHPSSALANADFDGARSKFLDEARVLAQFRHPGIVGVYGAFAENHTAYMAMEFLRGRSLQALLDERGPLPEREAVADVTRAGEALEVVHRANLLHRDLKPDNIMVTDDGRVVLIDFGNARTFAAGKTGRMTTMLTPGYAPLEQYGQYVRFGPFTDIYALAATLYHVVTGRMPTDATDRATGAPLPPPRDLNPAVSQGVSDAILWAMAIRVDRRPQTASAFVAALRAALPVDAPMALRRPREPDRSPLPAPAPATPPPGRAVPRDGAAMGAADDEPSYRVAVAGERLTWPMRCACCFEPAGASFNAEHTGGEGLFSLFQTTRTWEVPYCAQCLEHVRLAAESPVPSVGRLAAAPLVGAALGGPIGLLVGLGGAAAAGIMGAAQRSSTLAALVKPTCVASGPAVAYLAWDHGAHTFVFLNRDYVAAFRAENAARLVAERG